MVVELLQLEQGELPRHCTIVEDYRDMIPKFSSSCEEPEEFTFLHSPEHLNLLPFSGNFLVLPVSLQLLLLLAPNDFSFLRLRQIR